METRLVASHMSIFPFLPLPLLSVDSGGSDEDVVVYLYRGEWVGGSL